MTRGDRDRGETMVRVTGTSDGDNQAEQNTKDTEVLTEEEYIESFGTESDDEKI